MTRFRLAFSVFTLFFAASLYCRGDGLVRPPASYKGSLAEKSQEAIIVFRGGDEKTSAVEDLILKIQVEGRVDAFAWIVPLPSKPEVAKEDAKLFAELFQYVDLRTRPKPKKTPLANKAFGRTTDKEAKVEVLAREIVGSYDVSTVREKVPGSLNEWLKREGYQPIVGGDKVIDFYRQRDYVFACIKVSDAALVDKGSVELHPLRFTFETRGRDGIYFPMRLTGLQKERFDVNLYVFYRAWLNDSLNQVGFEHRGFDLTHRDWDTRECKANAGKTWSAPKSDPYLKGLARTIPTVTSFFQKRHPGKRFYLTNLRARNLRPQDVRDWQDDLWMFPYYTARDFVPYDAREGKIAAGTWE